MTNPRRPIKIEVVLNIIVARIEEARSFIGNAHKSRFMKFVIAKKKGQRYYLCYDKKQEVKISPDEEEDVTH